jgi:ADP-L-glycero-D-manno-heptose 6-epimerase
MNTVITGGAGFIGSCLVKGLNEKGTDELIIVDHLGENQEKWKNLNGLKFKDYMEKNEFLKRIEEDRIYDVEKIVHLGACADTTERDLSYLYRNNFLYSQILAGWAVRKTVNFSYASSAAVYGNGSGPLNGYGFSKYLFDTWILNNNMENSVTGFRFYNVYGPNECHKGPMASMIFKGWREIKETGMLELFKSYRSEYKDGEQKRDFIYVMDVVDLMIYLIFEVRHKGIVDIGTGRARSFNEVASVLFKAMKLPEKITYKEMPEDIKKSYQYFTQSDVNKLRELGYDKPFLSIEQGIPQYIKHLKEKRSCK